MAHELEHIEGVSHHHGDDGAIHYGDSSESSKHFAEHSASGQQTADFITVSQLPTVFTSIEVAPPDGINYLPDPLPERPQRPPQALG